MQFSESKSLSVASILYCCSSLISSSYRFTFCKITLICGDATMKVIRLRCSCPGVLLHRDENCSPNFRYFWPMDLLGLSLWK